MDEQGIAIQLTIVMQWTRENGPVEGARRPVLLRFREGRHAALGDIKNMYNCMAGGAWDASSQVPLEGQPR